LGLRIYPAHDADAVHRVFLCRIDPGIFQTGGPAGGKPPAGQRVVSQADPLHSHIHDIIERHMNRAIVTPVLWLFDKLRWMQHGDIHLYIGYILLAIVVLLFFV
jgi:hypothetical protein